MIKNWNLRTVLFIVLFSSGVLLQKAYSYQSNGNKVIIEGEWTSETNQAKTRNLSSIPISAYTDGTYLYIQNTSPNCDITVTITNEAIGDVVYERTFPQEATSYMVISIADLPAGVYMLELSNPDGGYLIGRFNK